MFSQHLLKVAWGLKEEVRNWGWRRNRGQWQSCSGQAEGHLPKSFILHTWHVCCFFMCSECDVHPCDVILIITAPYAANVYNEKRFSMSWVFIQCVMIMFIPPINFSQINSLSLPTQLHIILLFLLKYQSSLICTVHIFWDIWPSPGVWSTHQTLHS